LQFQRTNAARNSFGLYAPAFPRVFRAQNEIAPSASLAGGAFPFRTAASGQAPQPFTCTLTLAVSGSV